MDKVNIQERMSELMQPVDQQVMMCDDRNIPLSTI